MENKKELEYQFRTLTNSEIPEVAELFAKSFSKYPVFTHAEKNEQKLIDYLTIFFTSEIKHFIKNFNCKVLVDENNIIVAAVYFQAMSLKNKIKTKKIDFSNIKNVDYMIFVFKIYKLFLSLSINIPSNPNTFYVDSLAVNSNFQGKNIGSKLINDYLIPEIQKLNGQSVVLETNTEINRKFYIKNGFTEFAEKKKIYKNDIIPVWHYFKKI